MAPQVGREIDVLGFRVGHRDGLRLVLQHQLLGIARIVLDLQLRFDQQLGGRLVKMQPEHRIAEHVAGPAGLAGRRETQLGVAHPQFVAVVRSAQEAVGIQLHGGGIAIGRSVDDLQADHGGGSVGARRVWAP